MALYIYKYFWSTLPQNRTFEIIFLDCLQTSLSNSKGRSVERISTEDSCAQHRTQDSRAECMWNLEGTSIPWKTAQPPNPISFKNLPTSSGEPKFRTLKWMPLAGLPSTLHHLDLSPVFTRSLERRSRNNQHGFYCTIPRHPKVTPWKTYQPLMTDIWGQITNWTRTKQCCFNTC